MTQRILDRLREMGRSLDPEEVVEVCRKEMLALLPAENPGLPLFADRPCVVLVVGVNGTGKTTSTARLAHWLKGRGNTVMLAAADTFRAAAIEQMSNAVGGNCKAVGQLWAENALRGVWRMQCANGALSVGITLAPTEPARVQQFTVVPMRADAVLGPAPLCRQ